MDGYLRPIRTCSSIITCRSGLGDLPQQEIAVAPDPDEAVGTEQQVSGEALDRLAELDLRARLALGRQPAPRVVELVEGEANDLAPFGSLGAHVAKSITYSCTMDCLPLCRTRGPPPRPPPPPPPPRAAAAS